MRTRPRFAMWAVGLVVAVRAAAGSPAAETVVISLQGIDCQSCGAAVVELLERQQGVDSARFDRDLAEVEATFDPAAVDAESLVDLIRTAGYAAVVGAAEGSYAEALEFPETLDVEWLSRAGEDVDIESGLAEGKVTVFDFYAVWCGPCREVDREMRSILESSTDVALRKINVVDWNSPVAERYLKGASGLPYVMVYGTDGEKVATIDGLDLKRLRRAIEKGRRG